MRCVCRACDVYDRVRNEIQIGIDANATRWLCKCRSDEDDIRMRFSLSRGCHRNKGDTTMRGCHGHEGAMEVKAIEARSWTGIRVGTRVKVELGLGLEWGVGLDPGSGQRGTGSPHSCLAYNYAHPCLQRVFSFPARHTRVPTASDVQRGTYA